MAAERFDRARRLGLSFVEVVVCLAIVAVLGAVVAHNTASYRDRQRVNGSIAMLKHLGISVYRFDSAVGRFPGRVKHLHTEITGADNTICASLVYSTKGKGGGEVGAWEGDARGGPFYEYPTAESGFPIEIGVVSDTFLRSPTTASNDDRSFGALQIVVRGVNDDDVAEANLLVDRDANSAGGTVRWTADGLGANTMTWNIPIAGC